MKIYILCGLMLLFIYPSIAQQRGDKIESLKVAFITEKLNLDSKTAQNFWPIYNQYTDEMRTVLQQSRQGKNDNRNVDDILDKEQKALDIKKKYASQFSKVLNNDQVNQLFRAEKEFRQMVMRRAGN